MSRGIIILLLLSVAFATKILHHKCMHDEISESFKNEVLDLELNDEETRRL